MLLGADALGRLVLGQIPGTNASATGETITVGVSIQSGVAQGFGPPSQSARAGGPVGYQRKKKEQELDAFAWGTVFTVGVGVEAGIATGEIVVPMPEPLAPTLVPDFEPITSTVLGSTETPVVLIEPPAVLIEPPAVSPEPVLKKKDWTQYDNNLLELI
jgi:hypothetical protein